MGWVVVVVEAAAEEVVVAVVLEVLCRTRLSLESRTVICKWRHVIGSSLPQLLRALADNKTFWTRLEQPTAESTCAFG